MTVAVIWLAVAIAILGFVIAKGREQPWPVLSAASTAALLWPLMLAALIVAAAADLYAARRR